MSKGMKAFWEWMACKGYALSYGGEFTMYDGDTCLIIHTRQMLEGYMREFLTESGWRSSIRLEPVNNVLEAVYIWANGKRSIYAGPYDYQKVIEEVFG
jgi:hypothetical protein